jgi:hypothetical protein
MSHAEHRFALPTRVKSLPSVGELYALFRAINERAASEPVVICANNATLPFTHLRKLASAGAPT